MDRIEIIKLIRKDLKNGGRCGRSVLLAYAFLRGVPYRRVEKRTYADKHFENGTSAFSDYFRGVAYLTASAVLSLEKSVPYGRLTCKEIYDLRDTEVLPWIRASLEATSAGR